MSDEKPVINWNFIPSTTLSSGAYNPPVYPQIIPFNTNAIPLTPMTVSISQYNEVLSLYLARGDEIQRLQAVVRDAITNLEVKLQVYGSLPAPEVMLLGEMRQVMEQTCEVKE